MKTIYVWSLLCLLIVPVSCNANNNNSNLAFKPEKSQEIYTTKTDPDTRNIQVALLLDTSNSMDGLIDQAKAQLWEIVNELSYAKCGHYNIKLQIALYEYGNDRLPSQEGYIRQVLPFSNDLDEISKELFALTTNGGNEYCGKVINTSINQLDWKKSNDHLKLIFIAGNEPFTQGPIDYKDAATDAKEKDITVNTIFCGNYKQGMQTKWKDGANLTNGEYSAIDHNRETIHIATPYDDIILQLNRRLNNTYIYYGNEGSKKIGLQAEQDRNARSYSAANAVSRTISKSSGFYKNKSWDLVDAAEDKDFELEEVEKEELPQELKNKSKTELKQYVAKKSNERKEIQKKIQELNKKRMVYIQNNSKKDDTNLEAALIKAIKTQGERKSFSWKK
ncbi:von Willebrand factor type A domain-containing protein [Aquimarina amphilecti]|uniref:von Willebrand factor type A domain-containing protein n=1 Tax=Aquimarina amphilecti TaxID=1038014 RepID=A0A1H7N5F1_AQUAM|nr:vWA domain-containing protein [Aquimarina amphilecti]SEL18866.1 von Willebrand factor type A domain-containing protein [Aquimarina amphilecti]